MAGGPGRLFDEKGADLGGEPRELRLVEAAEVGRRVDRLEECHSVLNAPSGKCVAVQRSTRPSMAGGPLGQVLRHKLQYMRHTHVHTALASRGGHLHQAARVV